MGYNLGLEQPQSIADLAIRAYAAEVAKKSGIPWASRIPLKALTTRRGPVVPWRTKGTRKIPGKILDTTPQKIIPTEQKEPITTNGATTPGAGIQTISVPASEPSQGISEFFKSLPIWAWIVIGFGAILVLRKK